MKGPMHILDIIRGDNSLKSLIVCACISYYVAKRLFLLAHAIANTWPRDRYYVRTQ